jgi:hypothetical protein
MAGGGAGIPPAKQFPGPVVFKLLYAQAKRLLLWILSIMSAAILVTMDKSLASTFFVNEMPCMAAMPMTPTPRIAADIITSASVNPFSLRSFMGRLPLLFMTAH